MGREAGKQGLGAQIVASRLSGRRGRWTQKRLAERVGISEGYLRKIELGKQSPSVELVERIAEVLEVPLSFLVTGAGASEALEGVVRPFLVFAARAGLDRLAVETIVRGLSAIRGSGVSRPPQKQAGAPGLPRPPENPHPGEYR